MNNIYVMFLSSLQVHSTYDVLNFVRKYGLDDNTVDFIGHVLDFTEMIAT